MPFYKSKSRTWDRNTPNDGELFDDEFDQIYANFAALIPQGTILAWMPGYFTDGSNGGFQNVTITLADIWKECDGSLLQDSQSDIFNGTGRYLPNLTDNRFLMGVSVLENNGALEGGNNDGHYHSKGTLTIGNDSPDHSHVVYGGANYNYDGYFHRSNYDSTGARNHGTSGANTRHQHPITGLAGNTTGFDGDAAGSNLPKYLSCKYIMRIK